MLGYVIKAPNASNPATAIDDKIEVLAEVIIDILLNDLSKTGGSLRQKDVKPTYSYVNNSVMTLLDNKFDYKERSLRTDKATFTCTMKSVNGVSDTATLII